jgi:hypothetical protein
MSVKYPKPIKVHGAWDEWFNAQPEGDGVVEAMIDLLLYNPTHDDPTDEDLKRQGGGSHGE